MPKSILKSNQEIALLLMMRPARKPEGKRVHAALLARIEIAIAIESELAK